MEDMASIVQGTVMKKRLEETAEGGLCTPNMYYCNLSNAEIQGQDLPRTARLSEGHPTGGPGAGESESQ